MLGAFTKGVNIKSMIIAVIALFVYIVASDFLIHSLLMGDLYMQTANIWRPQADMESMMPFMFLGQLLIADFMAWIFIKGYEGGGIPEGIRFGILVSGWTIGGLLKIGRAHV